MFGSLAIAVSLALGPDDRRPAAGPCDRLAGSEPLRLERTRIGPYSTSAILGDLRALCPDVAPTLGSGFETVWAAVDLGIGDLRILAGQNWLLKMAVDDPSPDPVPDWTREASHWIVAGCGGALPQGVSTCATWAEVRAAYGVVGEGNADFGPVLVRLDALPGIELQLDVPEDIAAGLAVEQSLSSIPADARIVEIVLVP